MPVDATGGPVLGQISLGFWPVAPNPVAKASKAVMTGFLEPRLVYMPGCSQLQHTGRAI